MWAPFPVLQPGDWAQSDGEIVATPPIYLISFSWGSPSRTACCPISGIIFSYILHGFLVVEDRKVQSVTPSWLEAEVSGCTLIALTLEIKKLRHREMEQPAKENVTLK